MRRAAGFATVAVVGLLSLAGTARAQQSEDLDPCGSAVGRADAGACWAREADGAEASMREVYDALLKKLPARAASALTKGQKLWLEARDAHLALLYAAANPKNRHSWEDSICSEIARRELTLQRTLALKRLAQPAQDEACPL